MEAISSLARSAVQASAAPEGVREAPAEQREGQPSQNRILRPEVDRYAPEGEQNPAGLYRLGQDDEGNPKICFDAPEASGKPGPAVEAADRQADGGPEKKNTAEKAERCTCDTDKVDREIENLKKEQKELTRQLKGETDEAKIRSLEKKLERVESDLRQKDNDAYRRRHAVFS